MALGRSAAWNDLDAAWEAFAGDLVDHLDYEETEIFDDFGHESAAQASILTQLLADHTSLRERVEAITIEVRSREMRRETLASFIGLLREHSEREDASVYPWLQQRRGRHNRTDRTLP